MSQEVRRYIDVHLHDKLSLEEIAEYAELSPAYLSDLFHRETGFTVSRFILVKRIETAKNMLRYTDQTVAAIAENLAFSNASHFQRAFKKETGQTPNQYRRFEVGVNMGGAANGHSAET